MLRQAPGSIPPRRSLPLGAGQAHRHRKVAAKFLCEIDRYTSMDAALAIQELRMVVERHDRAVPDVRMDIEPAAAVTPERDEPFRCHIVPRHGKRHDETLAMQRIEQLASIWMIIGAPDQRAMTRFRRAAGCRLFRPVAPAEKVAIADGVVPSIEGLAFPPEFENTFGDTALIARIRVDRSRALRRPSDDLDREALWCVDEASIPLEAAIAR